jgi:hypothetical protein
MALSETLHGITGVLITQRNGPLGPFGVVAKVAVNRCHAEVSLLGY